MLNESKKAILENGWIYFDPHYFPVEVANELMHYFRSELAWETGSIQLFGKEYQIPRNQVYFADYGKSYGYSGKSMRISKWNEKVMSIRSKLVEEFRFPVNACLANLYRTGKDSNGWHADNEKELGEAPVIYSLSFGQTRKFQLKHLKTGERINLELNSGSLLIMGGEMQHYWKHQVPKQLKIAKDRVNLTFRYII